MEEHNMRYRRPQNETSKNTTDIYRKTQHETCTYTKANTLDSETRKMEK